MWLRSKRTSHYSARQDHRTQLWTAPQAESVSLCIGVQEAWGTTKLVAIIEVKMTSTFMYTDITGALFNIRGSPVSQRTKHIGSDIIEIKVLVEP
jgi:hypothetical protein